MLKIFFRSIIFFYFFLYPLSSFFSSSWLFWLFERDSEFFFLGISIFSRTEDRTIDRSALVKRSNARVLAHRSGNRPRWDLDECREFSPNLTRTLITDFSLAPESFGIRGLSFFFFFSFFVSVY